MHELVRIEALQRLGAGLLADALAHEGGVDAGIDDEMRDVNVLRPELARHALRDRAQAGQVSYEPLIAQVSQRLASNSEAVRARIGAPRRVAYGTSEAEKLDLYRTSQPRAPVFVYMHGGTWRWGAAKDAGFPAEMFVNGGAHYVALDFIGVQAAGGDLGVLATQVRRAIAWIYKNSESFGGDPERIYVGGHSSGGHRAYVSRRQASETC
jgi:acetyl esterase/lipase